MMLSFSLNTAAVSSKPNIIWFLTDDQDQMLGGSFPPTTTVNGDTATPMPKTLALMANQGATASNFFIHTPICCPSRSELLTGRYFHNIKQVGATGACMHANSSLVNENTFARNLAESGYAVGMFGKYLNNMPKTVPPGFDAWLANGGGDYIAPSFMTHNIDGLPNGTWTGGKDNYTTSVVGNTSMAWIEKQVSLKKPFLAYIAPKAAHEPFNPAPWYASYWSASWPQHEPRPVNWNCSKESRASHHGNIATNDMLTPEAALVVTDVFKNRWRTLMSVDDLISDVIGLCDKLGMMDNTYFFYSSDHGFQLGEFNILMDKRQPYDTNIRIHLLARGPGIVPGSVWTEPATQVDMAPTFLAIAGLAKPATMDGKSLLPLLINPAAGTQLPESVRKHLNSMGDASVYRRSWRDSVFIEYYFVENNDKCVANCSSTSSRYPQRDTWCGDLTSVPNKDCWGPSLEGCSQNCYPTESLDNNFIVLRGMSGSEFGDVLYAEFQHGNLDARAVNFGDGDINFYEFYDAAQDPWQVNNLYNATDKDKLSALHQKLHEWLSCKGDSCP